jgi:hypothetical protein
MLTKRIAASLAAIALSGTACLGLGVLPAQAAQSNCPSGYACIWADRDFKTSGLDGYLFKAASSAPNLANSYFSYSGLIMNANDRTSSLKNSSSASWVFYKDAFARGAHFRIDRGSARNNLLTSLSPIGFNDTISSFYKNG